MKPGAYATIDRLASALKADADRKVLVEGHTDSVGSDAYNQSLSERRAASVQAALFERGVAAAHITTQGMGETTPVAATMTPVVVSKTGVSSWSSKKVLASLPTRNSAS